MANDRKPWSWPPTRRDIVGLGNLLLFAAGLVIVGFGLANENFAFTALGVLAVALPCMRWFRFRRDAHGAHEFGGEMEKPPDSVSDSESESDSESAA